MNKKDRHDPERVHYLSDIIYHTSYIILKSFDCCIGVGPQQPIEIIYKTLKYCVRKGLKRPFLWLKIHF